MNIKDLFERKCINAHRAIDRNGKPRAVLYRHPDLYQWAKDSYEKGEEYFYISHPDPENPYHIVLGEPEYRWFLKSRDGLTDEEFEELCNESEIQWVIELPRRGVVVLNVTDGRKGDQKSCEVVRG